MDRAVDAAEQWLKDHDPHYAQTSRMWRTSQTDALEHQSTKANVHGTLQDLVLMNTEEQTRIEGARGIPRVVGDGNYRRQSAILDLDMQRKSTGRP